MQLVILIYHLTGASKILTIYMQIRVMVSSYLFLSGYGHFCYFFNKADFSLHRLLTVRFRQSLCGMLLSKIQARLERKAAFSRGFRTDYLRLSNHFRCLSVNPAVLRSRLITLLLQLYRVGQKSGGLQTLDHKSVKWPRVGSGAL